MLSNRYREGVAFVKEREYRKGDCCCILRERVERSRLCTGLRLTNTQWGKALLHTDTRTQVKGQYDNTFRKPKTIFPRSGKLGSD